MPDTQLIDHAYEAAVQKLYAVLLDAYVLDPSETGRKAADARFEHGLELARAARDRAKQLVE